MFLLKIGVPQTCFEIALTWSLSQGEDEEVADGLGDNSTRYPKMWISTVM